MLFINLKFKLNKKHHKKKNDNSHSQITNLSPIKEDQTQFSHLPLLIITPCDQDPLYHLDNINISSATGGVQQLKSVSNLSSLPNPKGHDQGYNAQPRLYGGLSRGGSSIAARPPPPFSTYDLVNFKVLAWTLVKGVNRKRAWTWLTSSMVNYIHHIPIL